METDRNQSSKFIWTTGHTFFTYQGIFLLFLPFYCIYGKTPSLGLVLTSLLLYILTEMSITAGYHRLFSHKTYKTNKIIEFFVLLFASMGFSKSAVQWCFEHRCHHAFTDTEDDPHSIKKGFWYAHMFWLFDIPKPIDGKIISDLRKNPLVRSQEKYLLLWELIPNFLAISAMTYFFNDIAGAFMVGALGRLFFNHHCTFSINSLAHTLGSRPYDRMSSSVNNFLFSVPTFGEGYHNYHHAFPNDYRNGVKWFEYDPTKWLIWTLEKLGMARDLKRASLKRVSTKLIDEKEFKK